MSGVRIPPSALHKEHYSTRKMGLWNRIITVRKKMRKKKEKMVPVTFTVPEKLFKRMEQLRKEEKKTRSVFCRGLIEVMVKAIEEWDEKEK